MKATKMTLAACAAALLTLGGCSSMSKTGKGALIGAGGGAAVGAGIGALIGGKQGAAVGAVLGGGLGTGVGAAVGKTMDRQAEQLAAQLPDANVETTEDVNGLKAIKVTFDGGILFATNSHELSAQSRRSLDHFAESLREFPDTDVTVYGHTDNTGTLAVNERVSQERAESVASYLRSDGVASGRLIKVEGLAYNYPVASNDTPDGRAKNRRVEIYITANEKMVSEAQQGY